MPRLSPEKAGGGSGGGGSGANVLTLYVADDESTGNFFAYKDSSRTQTYETYDEALNAAMSADIIKLMIDVGGRDLPYIGLSVDYAPVFGGIVYVTFGEPSAGDTSSITGYSVYLYGGHGGDGGDDGGDGGDDGGDGGDGGDDEK